MPGASVPVDSALTSGLQAPSDGGCVEPRQHRFANPRRLPLPAAPVLVRKLFEVARVRVRAVATV